MLLPDALGVLEVADLEATVDAIARGQESDGGIPWHPGGKMDPWNHVEAAMALCLGGRWDEVNRAYDWMLRNQRHDGAWHAYYQAGKVKDPTLDTNVSTYVATGAWHHYLVTGERGFLKWLWPSIDAAIEFALTLRRKSGVIAWSRPPDGWGARKGLVAGGSSLHLSLRCAVRVADALGYSRLDWTEAAETHGHAIRHQPGAFVDKHRWAMDWYYPILTGVLRGPVAQARLEEKWDEFVVPDKGVRCISGRAWVTAAETAELVMALNAIGDHDEARRLLEWAQHLRGDDAAYWMGANFTDGAYWPLQRPAWSSAAIVMAADALAGGPTAELFAGR
ncbi:MAG: prenyltransferase [Candidatus Dormiibacterota bacterium]